MCKLEFPAFLIEFPAAPCCIGEICHQFLQKVKFSHFEASAWNDVLYPFKFLVKSDNFGGFKTKDGRAAGGLGVDAGRWLEPKQKTVGSEQLQ